MSKCGQCEFYRNKPNNCPHQERTAFAEGCDKFKYTNPEKRIDYLKAENKKLCDRLEQQQTCIRELLPYAKELLGLEKPLLKSKLGEPEKVKKIKAAITKAEEFIKPEVERSETPVIDGMQANAEVEGSENDDA